MEIVTLAAWFHDTGYTMTADGYEDKSVELATKFLKERGYPDDKIAQVAGCINATKPSGSAQNPMEEIMSDAAMINVGKKKFFKKADLMRAELELRLGKPMAELEWLNRNIEYISKKNFRTKYAQMEYARQRTKNLIELQERLRDATDQHEEKEKKRTGKQEKDKIPVRGIDSMLRQTAGNHIRLSGIADHKAGILISTNSLMITLVATVLGRGLFEHEMTSKFPPHIIVPVIFLAATALTTIIFAVISTRPKITSGRFTKEDVQRRRVNLLFFGNFYNMEERDYEDAIREVMKDGDYLYGMMIRDIHSLGRVLAQKYMYLRISYTVFMFGLIATLFSWLVAYSLRGQDAVTTAVP